MILISILFNKNFTRFPFIAFFCSVIDFDWTLYLGLAFITAVFFAFGAALICCARRSIRVNQHYGMARSGKL